MATRARFTLDKGGMGELLKSPQMLAAMVTRAKRGAARAREIAPVGKGAGEETAGRYKGSIKVSSTTQGGVKRDRATAAVTADVPYARFVEYQPDADGVAHHTMLRAAQESG